ncbi:MAG: glycosyl hydrolase [Terriglobia bacterium]|nr:MAG: glycosyl hydrolase [Terriglobia bacterium]
MNRGFAAAFGLVSALLAPVMAQRHAQQSQPAGPWMDKSLSPDRRAELVVAQMTLEEKIQLVHGTGMEDFGPSPSPDLIRSNGGAGFVPGIPRLGLPDLNMADSAVGVARSGRRGRYATPLPSALALAATWDARMGYAYGSLIGRELRDQGYNVSLGGGVNIAREPRNGRNFEYQGEDPILAGKMVAQYIRGIQDQNILGDIKHYALNDQETGRYFANVKADRRTMRETDLLAFEIGIKEGRPGMVMCSYNLINGDYGCENDYTLNQVLKKAWGFPGFVISDWFATHSAEKAARAGLDMEQPGDRYFGTALKEAIQNRDVPTSRLDDMVRRILRSEFATGIVDNPPARKVPDVIGGMEVAQTIAERSMVLLKNAGGVLPLDPGGLKRIAVIGSHADVGVLSGGGSAQVDPPGGNAVPPPPVQQKSGETDLEAIFGTVVWQPSSPLKAIRAKAGRAVVEYEGGSEIAAAAAAAKRADVAIVFVNQPSTEGRDLTLTLPDNQDALVSAVAAANARTIVILETGGPAAMPWIGEVSAAVEAWFPGIRGGEAIANLLFGDMNPSGKLPVTFAKNEADLPHPKLFEPPVKRGPLEGIRETVPPFDVDYQEGLKVGYKWFDAENREPLFPFGHGLSYTNFAYSGLKVTPQAIAFTVRNTGKRAGIETAQVYTSLPAAANEPPKRLVGWEKVELQPGESKTVTIAADPLYFSIFNVEKDSWEVIPGTYTIRVGTSSRDLPLSGMVALSK